MTNPAENDAPTAEHDVVEPTFTREERTDVMSEMDVLAMEAVGEKNDGESVVADFRLSGAVPRDEPGAAGGHFRSKDVYLRLENQVYGPFTQEELDELLASGDLTGFESASNDLRTWTPLIYHPRMTLRGQIDPDATHNVLHQRSDLPTASRSGSVDLEALADEDEAAEEELPKMPLAAILIKPMKVSRSRGRVIEERVFANLDEESLEEVIERTGIPEAPPIPEEALRPSQPQTPAARDPLEETDELDMFVDAGTTGELDPDALEEEAPEPLPASADDFGGTLHFAPQDLPPVPDLPPATAPAASSSSYASTGGGGSDAMPTRPSGAVAGSEDISTTEFPSGDTASSGVEPGPAGASPSQAATVLSSSVPAPKKSGGAKWLVAAVIIIGLLGLAAWFALNAGG